MDAETLTRILQRALAVWDDLNDQGRYLMVRAIRAACRERQRAGRETRP